MSLRSFLDALARSTAAQREFFDLSRRTMLHVLSREHRKVPHQMLEDAVMRVFEQLWNGEIREFNSPHAPQSGEFRQDLARYLAYTIAPRRLVDQLRRTGREDLIGDLKRSNGEPPSDDELFDRLLPSPADDPVASQSERKQLLQRLARCVEHLSPKLREVVRSVLQDLTQADTAASLGIPEGTVKSRMNEATKRLKRCMGIGMEGA